MPENCGKSFKPCQSTFDPDALQVLQDAFDLAMVEVVARGISIDKQMVQDFIAKRIVAAARDSGERDRDRLKRLALQALEA